MAGELLAIIYNMANNVIMPMFFPMMATAMAMMMTTDCHPANQPASSKQ